MYDSETGRFISTDPLGDHYYGYSSYCYVANNPTIFTDQTGKYIILNGVDLDNTVAMLNRIVGTYFGPGVVTISGGNGTAISITQTGKISDSQKAVYDNLSSMINDPDRGINLWVTTQGMTSYHMAKINLSEMLDDERATEVGGASSMASLYHEITEQWYKQVELGLPAQNRNKVQAETENQKSDDFEESHAYGTRKEADVLGMFRSGSRSVNQDLSVHHYFDKKGIYLYSIKAKENKDGSKSTSRFIIKSQSTIDRITSELNELINN